MQDLVQQNKCLLFLRARNEHKRNELKINGKMSPPRPRIKWRLIRPTMLRQQIKPHKFVIIELGSPKRGSKT